MYAQLKEMMVAKGYSVSQGDGWTPADTEQFRTFSNFVLGVPFDQAYKVTTYPEDFRACLEAAVTNIFGEAEFTPPQPTAAPSDPLVNEPPSATEDPVADDPAPTEPEVVDPEPEDTPTETPEEPAADPEEPAPEEPAPTEPEEPAEDTTFDATPEE